MNSTAQIAPEHPLLPEGFDDAGEPYESLVALCRFVKQPEHITPRLRAGLAQAYGAQLLGAYSSADICTTRLLEGVGLLHTPGGLRRTLRDAWLIDVHWQTAFGATELHAAVTAFAVHPWPVWREARICPPLHATEHRPYFRSMFYAFQAVSGEMTSSVQSYRNLLAGAPKKSSEKFALQELWHPQASCFDKG